MPTSHWCSENHAVSPSNRPALHHSGCEDPATQRPFHHPTCTHKSPGVRDRSQEDRASGDCHQVCALGTSRHLCFTKKMHNDEHVQCSFSFSGNNDKPNSSRIAYRKVLANNYLKSPHASPLEIHFKMIKQTSKTVKMQNARILNIRLQRNFGQLLLL